MEHTLKLTLLDRVWHIDGSLPLPAGQSSAEALDRLDPLFRQSGTTSQDRTGDTLVFSKNDAASQDRMAVFDSGILKVEEGAAGAVLRYRLTSRILLFCFLLPLVFLAFAQATIFVNSLEGPAKEESAKKDKDVELPQSWIDKALGAPAPELPGKDKKDEKKSEGKHSATPAYVFSALFALLYIVGRVLEARKAKALFSRRLLGSARE